MQPHHAFVVFSLTSGVRDWYTTSWSNFGLLCPQKDILYLYIWGKYNRFSHISQIFSKKIYNIYIKNTQEAQIRAQKGLYNAFSGHIRGVMEALTKRIINLRNFERVKVTQITQIIAEIFSHRSHKSHRFFNKNHKNTFCKLWHFVPLLCHCHEVLCKQAFTSFLSIA